MNETNMSVNNLSTFSGTLASLYTPLFVVSPRAARAIEELQKATERLPFRMTDEAGDDEFGNQYEEGEMHEERLSGIAFITEELLREKGYDETVNDTLRVLNEEVENGHIQPGTIQHTVADYTIHALEAIRRREYVSNSYNREAKDFPGLTANQKTANFVFTPKMNGWPKEVKVKDANGKERVEYQYPEGFAEDRKEDAFKPRDDQRTIAKYTTKELDQAADRINFDGFTSAASGYMASLREINNMIGTQPPETPEQDRILRERARTEAERMKMEVETAMATDPNDRVAGRFFGDNLNYMKDTISSDPNEQRALSNDYDKIEKYIRFLDSGLPIQFYSEFQNIDAVLLNVEHQLYGCSEEVEGARDLMDKARSTRELLTNPPADMDEKTRAEWLSKVKDGCQECVDQYSEISSEVRLNEDAIRKGAESQIKHDFSTHRYCRSMADGKKLQGEEREKYIEELDKKLNATESSPEKESYLKAKAAALEEEIEKQKIEYTDSVLEGKNSPKLYIERIKSEVFPSMEQMGKKNIENRRKYITEMLGSMSNDMESISKGLKEAADKGGKLSPELKEAVDKAVKAGDPGRAASAQEYLQALEEVKTQAEKSGNTRIQDYVRKNGAYFQNRAREAESKGILMDESLKLQQSAIERDGKDNLKGAIDAFNTRRSGIFGGRGTEFGSESPEHKALREEATKLLDLKQKLKDSREKEHRNPEEWKKMTDEVKAQAEKVEELANDYLDKKGRSAMTSAGKARLHGAEEILKEAQITGVELKRREAAAARYESIGKETAKMREANVARIQELKEREQRIEREKKTEALRGAREEMRAAREEAGNRKDTEYVGRRPTLEGVKPDKPGRKATNMDGLAAKFGMDKDNTRKTAHKHKPASKTKQAVRENDLEEGMVAGGDE